MSEIERVEAGSLVLDADQYEFTPAQTQALVHIGVENASDGDLQVFFHVCKRTGLDPFARQIYMIARNVSERQADGSWRTKVKQTIQTGIDGFRLIGRRAADRAHHKVSVDAPEWAHEDGTWRPVWDRRWGLPIAARVTIHRDGEPFTAIALFDEYKQVKAGGNLTAMWDQRPAGQLAKCAEALAWRMAFPQDLSGIYVDEELEHADGAPRTETVQSTARVTAEHITGTAAPAPDAGATGGDPADVAASGGSDPATPVAPAPDDPDGITQAQSTEIGQLLQQIGVTERAKAVEYLNDCLPEGRTVRARKDLTHAEADDVLLALRDDAAKVAEGAAAATMAPDEPLPTNGDSL
jgi:phage recombination protein Bet